MLVVHRSASGSALASALAEVLRAPLVDPFAGEVVAVPAKGVERWLAQRLSHVLGAADGDGVCANVRFPSPAEVLDGAVAAASDVHREAVGAWAPARSTWSLLSVLDDAARSDDEWFGPLRHHLGGPGGTGSRRLAVVQRIARLLDDYGWSRPRLVRAWAAGGDDDGSGRPVAPDLLWQPQVWRRLRERLGPSPAEPAGHRGRGAAPRRRSGRPATAAVGLRREPVAAGARRGAGRARRAPRRARVAAPRLPRGVGRRGRGPDRAPPGRRRGRRAADEPAAGLPRPGRPRACSRCCARSPRGTEPSLHEGPPAPATLLGRLQHEPGHRHGARRPGAARTGRPQPAGARLPRPGAPGGGAARGGAGPARRRPDPRAPRRAGDVPRRRGLRPGGRRGLRAR
nr:exodeoxyribonuclease V subunit gamma [Angustibacter aerolatus]